MALGGHFLWANVYYTHTRAAKSAEEEMAVVQNAAGEMTSTVTTHCTDMKQNSKSNERTNLQNIKPLECDLDPHS